MTPVYLRCREGRVTWAYPRGALRVVLRLGATAREFRGCVRLRTALGRSGDATSKFGAIGWRAYLETRERGLVPLQPTASTPSCLLSHAGQAAIYLEADASEPGDVQRRVALLEYDLQPLPRGAQSYDPAEGKSYSQLLINKFSQISNSNKLESIGMGRKNRQESVSYNFAY